MTFELSLHVQIPKGDDRFFCVFFFVFFVCVFFFCCFFGGGGVWGVYPSLYKIGARSRSHAGGVAPLFFAAQIEDAPKFPSPKFKDCTKLVAIAASGREPRRKCFSRRRRI